MLELISHRSTFTNLDQDAATYSLDAAKSQKYDGHTVTNLRTQWQINENFAISLEILNLFAARYAEHTDFVFGKAS